MDGERDAMDGWREGDRDRDREREREMAGWTDRQMYRQTDRYGWSGRGRGREKTDRQFKYLLNSAEHKLIISCDEYKSQCGLNPEELHVTNIVQVNPCWDMALWLQIFSLS